VRQSSTFNVNGEVFVYDGTIAGTLSDHLAVASELRLRSTASLACFMLNTNNISPVQRDLLDEFDTMARRRQNHNLYAAICP